MSKKCPACGAVVSDTAKFCRECGTKIVIEKFIFCEECGTKCKSTDKFCEECGFNFSGDAAPAPNTACDNTPTMNIDLSLFDPVVLTGKSKYYDGVKIYRTYGEITMDEKIEMVENSLKPLADAGDAKAIWLIGKSKQGIYTEEITMPYFEKAASLGFFKAEVDFALDLMWDDEEEGERRLKELAAMGDAYALYEYASHLLNATDEEIEIIDAFFERAANGGEPMAFLELISRVDDNNKIYYNVEWIKKLFELRPSVDPEDPEGAIYDESLAYALGSVAEKIESGKIPELDMSVAAVARQRCLAMFNCQEYRDKLNKVKDKLPKR